MYLEHYCFQVMKCSGTYNPNLLRLSITGDPVPFILVSIDCMHAGIANTLGISKRQAGRQDRRKRCRQDVYEWPTPF